MGGGFLLGSVGLSNLLISVGLIFLTGSVRDVPNLGIALSDLSTLLWVASACVELLPVLSAFEITLSPSVNPDTEDCPSEAPVLKNTLRAVAEMFPSAAVVPCVRVVLLAYP